MKKIVVRDAERKRCPPIYVQPVLAMDLAQPGVLRAPGMIHRHRPLGDRVEREGVRADLALLERDVPERQGIEIGLHPRPVVVRRLHRAMALGSEAEFLQDLAVEQLL